MIRRTAGAFTIFVIAGSVLVIAQEPRKPSDGSFAIRAEPVPLRSDEADLRDVGGLRYLGG